MKTIDDIYKEWCGCTRLENSVKLVHDSTEAIEFAAYYASQSKNIPSDDIEKWLDKEYPLYKNPNKKEREINTIQLLIRDGINYFAKHIIDFWRNSK